MGGAYQPSDIRIVIERWGFEYRQKNPDGTFIFVYCFVSGLFHRAFSFTVSSDKQNSNNPKLFFFFKDNRYITDLVLIQINI